MADFSDFLLKDNKIILNYIFKENKIYYITFSVKTKPASQSFKLELINLNDSVDFDQSEKQLINNFIAPANANNVLRGFSCIFSPYSQSFNGLIWTPQEEILNDNNQLFLSNVKIYQVHKIKFFENKQDDILRRIVKISVLGNPNTHVAINNNDLQIGLNGNLELPYNFIINSVGVASDEDFVINLMYQII